MLGQEAARAFLERLDGLLELLLPAYVAEGKSYLTVAFGCTGGRHRSVAIAEEVAELLRGPGLRAHGRPPGHRQAERRLGLERRRPDLLGWP